MSSNSWDGLAKNQVGLDSWYNAGRLSYFRIDRRLPLMRGGPRMTGLVDGYPTRWLRLDRTHRLL
jgi:hypothetical protein